eukprot:TRINITY_DN495_c11_g1_i1.p1 TRINITY_DN495_c11_g1~~TRINITY_DN495_c11_g1_i1.p1  ORF type:complete len:1173 (+),score=237.30 TRINITY_DN495_c11_g1_i1:67-3585(+)
MEELVRDLQERQAKKSLFVGKKDDIVRQLAILGETDEDYEDLELVQRASKILGEKVDRIMAASENTHISEEVWLTTVKSAKESKEYQLCHAKISEEAENLETNGYMLPLVTQARPGRNHERSTSLSAQIFTLDDELSEWCEPDDVMEFHKTVKQTAMRLSGVAVSLRYTEEGSEVEDMMVDVTLIADETTRIALLTSLNNMAAEICDTEDWPTMRENLVRSLASSPPVAHVALRTLLSVIKVCECWQTAQITTSLIGLFDRDEGSYAAARLLHRSLCTVETQWMYIDFFPRLLHSLTNMLASRAVLTIFASIDPTALWFELYMKSAKVRSYIFSNPGFLRECCLVAFCENVDESVAALNGLQPAQRLSMLQTASKDSPACESDQLLLHCISLIALTLTYEEGRRVFPVVLNGSDLMHLHMFATHTSDTSLLLSDDHLVASTALHGVILHSLRGLYGNAASKNPFAVISSTYSCLLSFSASFVDPSVSYLVVHNYLLPLIDIAAAAEERPFDSVLTATLVAEMRFLTELTKQKIGRDILTHHPVGDSLLSIVVKFLLKAGSWKSRLRKEALSLARAILQFPSLAVHAPVNDIVTMLKNVVNERGLEGLDPVVGSLHNPYVARAVASDTDLMYHVVKRSAVGVLTEGTPALTMLVMSGDLLSEVTSIPGVPGLEGAMRYWQAETNGHCMMQTEDNSAALTMRYWEFLRAAMICSTTWQNPTQAMHRSITAVLKLEADCDVEVSVLSALALGSVMLLDSALLLISKYDVVKELQTLQMHDLTLHPASLLRHIMLCAVGVIGGPGERQLPKQSSCWEFLFFKGLWAEQPDIEGPLGVVNEAHCGVLYDDEEGEAPECNAPELSDIEREEWTPRGWTYPIMPDVMVVKEAGQPAVSLSSLTTSLAHAVEQVLTAVSNEMNEAKQEWVEGVKDIFKRALLLDSSPVHNKKLFRLIFQFIIVSEGIEEVDSVPAEPHQHAEAAATAGVKYGTYLGLLDQSKTQSHIADLSSMLTTIDWTTVVLFILGVDRIQCVNRLPGMQFFKCTPSDTLRVSAAVEHLLNKEALPLLNLFRLNDTPAFYVVNLWTHQMFLNFLDWQDVLSTLSATLLYGPECLPCIIYLCLAYMKPLLVAQTDLAAFLASSSIVNQKHEGFRVSAHLNSIQELRAKYGKELTNILCG